MRLGVRLATRGAQVPWESTSLEEDVYIMRHAKRRLSDAELDQLLEREMTSWRKVKTSTDPEVLAGFIREFPSGSASELAQSRLNRLLAAAIAEEAQRKQQLASQRRERLPKHWPRVRRRLGDVPSKPSTNAWQRSSPKKNACSKPGATPRRRRLFNFRRLRKPRHWHRRTAVRKNLLRLPPRRRRVGRAAAHAEAAQVAAAQEAGRRAAAEQEAARVAAAKAEAAQAELRRIQALQAQADAAERARTEKAEANVWRYSGRPKNTSENRPAWRSSRSPCSPPRRSRRPIPLCWRPRRTTRASTNTNANTLWVTRRTLP